MREYIDVTGRTEDEAISKALAQLHLERDDVSVEILERAKSGFLGLGSCPAKVRVFYGEEPEQPQEEPVPAEKPAPVPAAAPVQTPERPAEPEKKPEQRTVSGEQTEAEDEKAAAIRTFLTGLLQQMETPAEIHVYLPEKGRYQVVLEGKNLGALIGRRGETLDAIQQLTNYSVNRRSSGRARV